MTLTTVDTLSSIALLLTMKVGCKSLNELKNMTKIAVRTKTSIDKMVRCPPRTLPTLIPPILRQFLANSPSHLGLLVNLPFIPTENKVFISILTTAVGTATPRTLNKAILNFVSNLSSVMAVVETGSVATVRREVTIVTFSGSLG